MASFLDMNIPKAIAKALRLSGNDPLEQQLQVLKKLLKKARFTAFGQHYHFDDILFSSDLAGRFQELVPVHDYK
jgi:hypothetical protein